MTAPGQADGNVAEPPASCRRTAPTSTAACAGSGSRSPPKGTRETPIGQAQGRPRRLAADPGASAAARAQDSVIVIDPDAPITDTVELAGPPADVVEELIAFYNDSSTTRVEGDITLPRGQPVRGSSRGLSGHPARRWSGGGAIAVANGTLQLCPGADHPSIFSSPRSRPSWWSRRCGCSVADRNCASCCRARPRRRRSPTRCYCAG